MPWHPPPDARRDRLAQAIGSAVIAHGIVAMLRAAAWEGGAPDLGTADDIGRIVEWNGEPDRLLSMLTETGVVVPMPETPGRYSLDAWLDHAPPTVLRWAERAGTYHRAGITIREMRALAGRASGEARKRKKEERQLSLLAAEEPKPRRAPRKKRRAKEADPRFAVLRAAWEEEFKAATGELPRWSAADAVAVHRIIAVPPDELRRRARRSLHASGYLHCGSLAKLCSTEVWNQLAGASGANGVRRVVGEVGDFSNPDALRADLDRALGKEPTNGK